MRLIVFFDLPTTTEAHKKAYTKFRKWLLNDGYLMMQFSVYSRICNGPDSIDAHLRRLEAVVPSKGIVSALSVTEKQYATIKLLSGSRKIIKKPSEGYQNTFFDEDF